MSDDGWPSEWLRGVLTLCVLRALEAQPTYGYAIAVELERLGFGTLKGGTLYPLLARLEEQGLVQSFWQPGESGPGRKYFMLNEQGRAQLHELGQRWSEFAALTTTYINSGSATKGTS